MRINTQQCCVNDCKPPFKITGANLKKKPIKDRKLTDAFEIFGDDFIVSFVVVVAFVTVVTITTENEWTAPTRHTSS